MTTPRSWLLAIGAAFLLVGPASAADVWLVGAGKDVRIQEGPPGGTARSFSRVAVSGGNAGVSVTRRTNDWTGSATYVGGPVRASAAPSRRSCWAPQPSGQYGFPTSARSAPRSSLKSGYHSPHFPALQRIGVDGMCARCAQGEAAVRRISQRSTSGGTKWDSVAREAGSLALVSSRRQS